MENQPPNILAEISDADWENTPESVKQLVGKLMERIVALEQRQEHLEELLKRNSKNSSQPPSQDVAQGFKPKPKATEQKKRGGKRDMQGTQRSCMKRKSVRQLKSITRSIVAPVERG